MEFFLDFERPIAELNEQIKELQSAKAEGKDIPIKDVDGEIERLQIKQARVARLIYRNMSPWQKVQVARHPERPHAKDYIAQLITDFIPLAGDRAFADDKAMIAGLGNFNGAPVAVLGIEKGNSTKSRVEHNFGMPKPEGYRKAKRIMELADKFKLPLITFVDTPGAFPGIEAEARGQGEAIAACIETLLTLNVPVVSVITGEGGSGGALAVATADKVLMLEHSIYSVISPEGCASILWKRADKDTIPQASEALNLTAQDLEKHRIIDEIIKEPVGGAHRDRELTFKRVTEALTDQLAALNGKANKKSRRERFLNLTK